jgi:hypothetical protein
VFALSGFCAGLGGAIIGLRSGTAQALGLQYLLLAGTVAAFIGGVSIHGGRGGVIGAAIGTLTVNFLDTGLVFNVTPAYVVQLCLGVLLISSCFRLGRGSSISIRSGRLRLQVRPPPSRTCGQTKSPDLEWRRSSARLNRQAVGRPALALHRLNHL